jgi:hypothetical protein
MCEDDFNPEDHYTPDKSLGPLQEAEPDDPEHRTALFCENYPGCIDADWLYELKYRRRHERMEVEDAGGDPIQPFCP